MENKKARACIPCQVMSALLLSGMIALIVWGVTKIV